MASADEQLIQRCREEDRAALEELLARYQDRLMAFIYSVVRDYHLAEDIFQETFLRVYREARGFRSGASFKTWLYTIAVNRCRDALRKSKRRPEVSLDFELASGETDRPRRLVDLIAGREPGPRDQAGGREMEAILEGELSGLSEEHRQVIVLSRLNGLKYREIAEVLGIPSGTVRSRLHYALEHLRRGLATRGIEG
jgi:RNA polymerase sigma-70 factor, ECF subfamily